MLCHRRRRETQSEPAAPSCLEGYDGSGPSSAPPLRIDGKASIWHVGTQPGPEALVMRLTRLLPRTANLWSVNVPRSQGSGAWVVQ